MFLEEFHTWNKCTNDERAAFAKFIEHWLSDRPNLNSVVENLAWQVYQLQICVEGLIDDVDLLSEDCGVFCDRG